MMLSSSEYQPPFWIPAMMLVTRKTPRDGSAAPSLVLPWYVRITEVLTIPGVKQLDYPKYSTSRFFWFSDKASNPHPRKVERIQKNLHERTAYNTMGGNPGLVYKDEKCTLCAYPDTNTFQTALFCYHWSILLVNQQSSCSITCVCVIWISPQLLSLFISTKSSTTWHSSSYAFPLSVQSGSFITHHWNVL